MSSPRLEVRGFTLIEVLVALAIGGTLVLAAHGLFALVAEAAGSVPALASSVDESRNRDLLLRELLAQVETGTDSGRTFAGGPRGARFTSWCPEPGGWRERCTVDLTLDRREDSVVLVARWGGRSIDLGLAPEPAALYYLARTDDGDRWMARWGTSLTPPLAVLAILGSDTLILRIGERG